MIIRYFYNHKKELNFTRVCNGQNAYLNWLEIDQNLGHKIIFNSRGYDCYIDY